MLVCSSGIIKFIYDRKIIKITHTTLPAAVFPHRQKHIFPFFWGEGEGEGQERRGAGVEYGRHVAVDCQQIIIFVQPDEEVAVVELGLAAFSPSPMGGDARERGRVIRD